MSINEILDSQYFWRDSTRKAPHNLYTSSENILNSINHKNFKFSPSAFATFNEAYYHKEKFLPISNISLELNKSYNTTYEYSNDFYKKSMDGEVAIDEANNLPLLFSNIVIQKTDISLQQDNTHLNINLLGEGEGYIFSKGVYTNVILKKIPI